MIDFKPIERVVHDARVRHIAKKRHDELVKKRIAIFAVGFIILWALATAALALPLYINGKLQPGDVTKVEVTTSSVRITATEVKPPEPPDPPKPPEPSTPYARGYDISLADWTSPAHIDDLVTIPQGKAIASKFRTDDVMTAYGTFNFETPVGGETPNTYLWVSAAPGGSPLPGRCSREWASFIYSLKWTMRQSNYCVLRPNTVYYINLKHHNVNNGATRIKRTLTKAGR